MPKPTFLYALVFLLGIQLQSALASTSPIDDIQFTKVEVLTEHTTRIPFKLVDHLIVVEAKTYGQVGNFIIDTGSEGLLLNEVHFKKSYNSYSSKTGAGVNGAVSISDEKRVPEFLLRDFNIKHKNAQIINLSHLEKTKKIRLIGIIGYDILKEYEVFIDFYLKQITLFKTDRKGNRIDTHLFLEKVTDSVDFKLKKHSIVLQGSVNGESLNFALDTGAEINQLSKSVSKKVLKKFRPIKRIKLRGMDQRKIEVLAGKLYGVKLTDRVYCGVMRTIITNLRKMNEAYGTKIDGVLGYEFIAMRRLVINYRKKKLYFVKLPYN